MPEHAAPTANVATQTPTPSNPSINEVLDRIVADVEAVVATAHAAPPEGRLRLVDGLYGLVEAEEEGVPVPREGVSDTQRRVVMFVAEAIQRERGGGA